MSFTTGDVVAVKTTGERVVVTKVADDNFYEVRRPVQTRDGLAHSTEVFMADELEAEAASEEREYRARMAEYKKVQRLNDAIKEMQTAEAAKPAVVN